MAYTRENLLRKIIAIQDIVLKAKSQGISQKYVYENQIKDVYYISPATFNMYLTVNAKKELETFLRRKQESENEKKKQQTIEFSFD